jgi:hypothetical protein
MKIVFYINQWMMSLYKKNRINIKKRILTDSTHAKIIFSGTENWLQSFGKRGLERVADYITANCGLTSINGFWVPYCVQLLL